MITRKQTFVRKASGSTTSDNLYAASSAINETGMAVNNNTKAMANMVTQNNSTNAIMFIAIAGIVAYMVYLNSKKK